MRKVEVEAKVESPEKALNLSLSLNLDPAFPELDLNLSLNLVTIACC